MMTRKTRITASLLLVFAALAPLLFASPASAKEWKNYTLSDGSSISLPADWGVTLSKKEPSSVEIDETFLWHNDQHLAEGRINNTSTMFTLSKKWFSNSTGAIAPIPQSLFTAIFNAMNSDEDSQKHITKKTRSYQRPYGEVKSFNGSTKEIFIHRSAVLHNDVIYLIRILSLEPLNDADTLVDKILNRWEMDPPAPAKSTSSTTTKDWTTYKLPGGQMALPAEWKAKNTSKQPRLFQKNGNVRSYIQELVSWEEPLSPPAVSAIRIWLTEDGELLHFDDSVLNIFFNKFINITNGGFGGATSEETHTFQRPDGRVLFFKGRAGESYLHFTMLERDSVLYCLGLNSPQPLETSDALINAIYDRWQMEPPSF